MASAGVVRVTLQWVYSGSSPWAPEEAVNTFHVQRQSGASGDALDVQYIADQISGKFVTGWSAVSGLHASQIRLASLNPAALDLTGHATAAGFHDATSAGLVGSGSSGMLPPEVAVCLSYAAYPPGGFTQNKGRKRSRMYLPGISQGRCTDDGLFDLSGSTAALNGWRDIFNAINTIPVASGSSDHIGLVNYSRVDFTAYEALYVHWDDHFDAQRRRQHQAAAARADVTLTGWA